MKKILLLVLALSSFSVCKAQDTFKFGSSVNPNGETFLVDRHGIINNGKHTLSVMGEIHYSRVPEKEWRREIRKMKAGGITIVSTYVFWNHHEAEQGKWDWSGNKNLHDFIKICGEEGMNVVLRIGPFCHGEVYQGGFPDWVVNNAISNLKQFKLRSEAPGFIEETTRLYSNIYAQVNDLLWKHGGPIVGVQIENECRGPWSYYMTLKNIAVNVGFDVPFYTRTGWPKLNGKEEFGKMLPLYGDYADGFWDRVLTDMPGDYRQAFVMKDTRVSGVIATETFGTNQDTQMEAGETQYPYLTCELGGGMMPSYHRRINISGKEAFPLAICKLGSGSNLPGYYMYHGGTNPFNPTRTMAECQASSVTNYNDMPHMTYDFQSPIGEIGQINEVSFHETRWLHQFLSDWGDELSIYDVDTLSSNYARRGCFEFRNDYIRILNEQGTASVTPCGMQHNELTISSSNIQPFAKTNEGNELYFITVQNKKPVANINSKSYKLKLDKPNIINGKIINVLSQDKAKSAYVIDDKMYYSQHGGVLYKADSCIVEEWFDINKDLNIDVKIVKETSALRNVKLGSQKVAEQPSESDFSSAGVWNVVLPESLNSEEYWKKVDDLFLKINYKGDVARIYANGVLVQDNFWNGKPMFVRVSDLVGKNVELRVLPLGKEYPIYLQSEQKKQLNAASGDFLLSLDSIEMLERKYE